MYFFEFKLSIDNIIEKINDIKKVYYRFIESFENIKTTQGFNINYNFIIYPKNKTHLYCGFE